MGQVQLKSALDNFLHEPAPLETIWLHETQTLPNLNNQTSMKLLQKLFANNITTITQITLPNGTHLMNEENYKNSYSTPTRLVKSALNLAKQLFCHSECSNTCLHPCITQHNPYTLKVEYISANGTTHTPIIIPHTLTLPVTTTTSFPKPPPHIPKSHTQYPIQAILQHKYHTHKDNQKIQKSYISYQCQWTIQDATYNQWQPQRALFPQHAPNTIKHNITCLKKYYLKRKNETQQQIFHNHHPQEQRQDPRFISPPTHIPLTNISITECNPSKDIITQTQPIQIQQN